MKPIDPLQLQRLVDGELDRPEIQQVLTEAKSAPQQWQEIAVGFVENQLWEKAFRSEHLEPPTNCNAGALDDKKEVVQRPVSNRETATGSNPFLHRSSYSRLVMAASLLAAAMIGYMANQIQNRNIPSPEIAADTPRVTSEPQVAKSSPDNNAPGPKLTPASLQPAYHLEVPQDNEHFPDLAAAGPVAPIPLYGIGNAEQLKQFNLERAPANFPPEMVRRLNGTGYQMQQDIHFISGRLSDGRSFVVPVRTIRFLPGQ